MWKSVSLAGLCSWKETPIQTSVADGTLVLFCASSACEFRDKQRIAHRDDHKTVIAAIERLLILTMDLPIMREPYAPMALKAHS